MEDPICEFRAVSKDYAVRHGFFASSTYRIKALDRVNLSVKEGEILGLVGESGCGKSTLARIALGLESPTSGQVLFSGDDIADFDKTRLQNFRRQAQMVFQDPFSSLNPKKTVLKILSEPLKIHRLYSKNHYKERVIRLLKEVGLDEQVLNRYPHEFSGGQRQRIGLARALATNPKMIVADEPTSALDVSIQAQIINLFLDLHERHRLSLLFISHDLPVIQFVSHRVAVMYKGQLMELMPKNAFLQSPNHQITKSLNCSIECLDPLEKLLADKGHEIAGIILEPLLQAAGGMIAYPVQYLKRLAGLASHHRIHLILDEVATGFGRTGRMFAFEHAGIAPDFLCLSKGLTAGFIPMAATITTDDVYHAFYADYEEGRTFFHGHTFTGNPLASAAALASLEIFEQEKVLDGLQDKIDILQSGMERFKELPWVGDVRGIGMVAAVELVMDRRTRTPFSSEKRVGWMIYKEGLKKGLILRPLGDIVYLFLPLSVNAVQIEDILNLSFDVISGLNP